MTGSCLTVDEPDLCSTIAGGIQDVSRMSGMWHQNLTDVLNLASVFCVHVRMIDSAVIVVKAHEGIYTSLTTTRKHGTRPRNGSRTRRPVRRHITRHQYLVQIYRSKTGTAFAVAVGCRHQVVEKWLFLSRDTPLHHPTTLWVMVSSSLWKNKSLVTAPSNDPRL